MNEQQLYERIGRATTENEELRGNIRDLLVLLKRAHGGDFAAVDVDLVALTWRCELHPQAAVEPGGTENTDNPEPALTPAP